MKEAPSSAPAAETAAVQALGTASPATPTPSRTARATIVLGVDPGTRCLGYGAIVLAARGPRLLAAGVVRATQSDVPARLGHLRRELDRLFERLAPDVIVVEQAFAARNVQSALRIGEGRGVVLCCAAHVGARIVQYAPAVAKKALVGNGSADKTQVARMVVHLLGRKSADLPVDASDALALALCHAQRAALERLRSPSVVDARLAPVSDPRLATSTPPRRRRTGR